MTEHINPMILFPETRVPEDVDDLAFLWEETDLYPSTR